MKPGIIRISCYCFCFLGLTACSDSSQPTPSAEQSDLHVQMEDLDVPFSGRFSRALLISVDGMHAIDLARYVKEHPDSAMAQLSSSGMTYTNARTPLMADSTPGLISLVAGGTPAVTGLMYSPFYDRDLSPPGSDCSTRGTVYYVDEKWVLDFHREDSGGGVDPEKFARDPDNGCEPVYPRHLMRVNTMFEVVKRAGGRTAWIDQHEMYNDLLKGAAGDALDDSRALERKGTPGTLEGSTAQDGRRLAFLLNQIRGMDSSGENLVGVPNVFGMGFISFGMMQKSAGYADGDAKPSEELGAALDFVDESLGQMISALDEKGLRESTLIILSSKHGQSPIDPGQVNLVDRDVIRDAVSSVEEDLLAQGTMDSIGLLWLNDSSRTAEVVAVLRTMMREAGIRKIYSGQQLDLLLSIKDSRTPDIMLQPELGTFWTDDAATKTMIAEHGGMLDDDVNVPLLVSYTGSEAMINRAPVHTSQVAPTILTALGIDPGKLEAVQQEGTPALPGLPADW